MSVEMTPQRYVSLLREAGIKDADEVIGVCSTGGPMIIPQRTLLPLLVFFDPDQVDVFRDNYDEIKLSLGESSEGVPDQASTG